MSNDVACPIPYETRAAVARATKNKGRERRSPHLPNEKSRKRGPFVSQKTRAANAALAVTQIFFFGAIIMTICRPSRRGRDSTTMFSPF